MWVASIHHFLRAAHLVGEYAPNALAPLLESLLSYPSFPLLLQPSFSSSIFFSRITSHLLVLGLKVDSPPQTSTSRRSSSSRLETSPIAFPTTTYSPIILRNQTTIPSSPRLTTLDPLMSWATPLSPPTINSFPTATNPNHYGKFADRPLQFQQASPYFWCLK